MIVGADASRRRHHPVDQAHSCTAPTALQARLLLGLQPDPDAGRALPLKAPPLVREHRLYQADWLMRFYGFERRRDRRRRPTACCRWTSTPSWRGRWRIRERFPGRPQPRAARTAAARAGPRRQGGRPPAARPPRARLRCDDLQRLHVPLGKVLPFITMPGHRSRADRPTARALEAPAPVAAAAPSIQRGISHMQAHCVSQRH